MAEADGARVLAKTLKKEGDTAGFYTARWSHHAVTSCRFLTAIVKKVSRSSMFATSVGQIVHRGSAADFQDESLWKIFLAL